MMRQIVHGAINDVTESLDAISLPGADLELKAITDFEDSAIGAGLLSLNKKLFDDNDQARQCVLCQYYYPDSEKRHNVLCQHYYPNNQHRHGVLC